MFISDEISVYWKVWVYFDKLGDMFFFGDVGLISSGGYLFEYLNGLLVCLF